MTQDLTRLSATEAVRRLRARELLVETYVAACLKRIETREPLIRAWSYLHPERALDQARALDRQGPSGPLHGLPIGVKDVLLTRDMPTQYNSPIYKGFQSGMDAACVKILRQSGALILGKTETVEFAAIGQPAGTRNPRDLNRTPGGSSSGSAAAVADDHVPLSLGTQTGGSMIRPASFCGIYGFKPTWGLFSTEGAKRFSVSLDTLGWFARSAEDLVLIHDVLDPEPGTQTPLVLAGARVALCRSPVWDQAEAATQAAMENAASLVRAAGARVEPLDLPADFDALPRAQAVIMHAEGRSAFLCDYRADAARLHPNLGAMVENTRGFSRADLLWAYDLAARCRAQFDGVAAAYDAVITPSTPGEAPLGLAQTGSMAFNAIWTVLHAPCVNIPGFTVENDLPVGLTVVGPRFSDRKVLAAALALGLLFADGAAG